MPNTVQTKISPPTPPPFPIPSSKSVIHLPADHYLHPNAQTEWWWHVGTLEAGHRTFGFEINAAAFYLNKVMFTQVMLTDVDNKVHYRQSTPRAVNAAWAEADPKKNWWVKQGDPATESSWVTMNAPQADPSKNMVVKAAMVDEVSGKPIKFDLTFSQEGPPFIVWGTGVTAGNYYYSLTRLNASGTVTIADEALRVHGLTWMDHEYGQFGTPRRAGALVPAGHAARQWRPSLELYRIHEAAVAGLNDRQQRHRPVPGRHDLLRAEQAYAVRPHMEEPAGDEILPGIQD